jgi:hypothetical protein
MQSLASLEHEVRAGVGERPAIFGAREAHVFVIFSLATFLPLLMKTPGLADLATQSSLSFFRERLCSSAMKSLDRSSAGFIPRYHAKFAAGFGWLNQS